MNRSSRGATSVGLIWVVVLVVLLLASAAVIWAVNADKTQADLKIGALTKERDEKDVRITDLKKKILEISKVIGFKDENDPGADVRPDQVAGTVKSVGEKYGLGPDATTASKVIERLTTQIDELTRTKGEAITQQTQAEQARAALQGNLQDVTKTKDEELEKVNKQLTDERDRHANQETTDKGRIDDLTKRLADAEGRAKADKAEDAKQIAKLTEEVKVRDERIAQAGKKLEMIKQPDTPDGSVVDVSNANTCYVDIGAKQMLRRGTRFKVFNYTKNGAIHDKGMIEITKVEDSMSTATVTDLKDKYDPISKGDKIAAPNYDPKMPREFVLMGRFPSGYSRAMVADRLRSLGATVKEKVGPSTDFLILGDKDEGAAKPDEAKEGGDEAKAAGPSDDEQLKLAQLYKVQIMPVREILDYLRYE
jgi:predicted  nucleic acid-binding Zn-ribbon protein